METLSGTSSSTLALAKLNRCTKDSIMAGMQVTLLRVAMASAKGSRRAFKVSLKLALLRFQITTTANARKIKLAAPKASTKLAIASKGSTPDLAIWEALMQTSTMGRGKFNQRVKVWQVW